MCQLEIESFDDIARALAGGNQTELRCTHCDRTLSIAMFFRWRGIPRSPCRDCLNSRARIERNREKRRIEARARYAANRSRLKDQVRRYAAANPEKIFAHNKVTHAIESGRLERKPCEICGSEKSEAHHHDYSKDRKSVGEG